MTKDFWLQARKVPAVLYGLGVFALSAQSSLPTIAPFSWFDKVEHAIEYAIFSVFVIYGWPKIKPTILIMTLGLFAFSDELHQYFVPGRFATIGDWIADTVGISMCAGLWSMIKKYERR